MSRRSGLGAEPTLPLGIKPVLLGDVLVLTTSALDTLNSLPFIFPNWALTSAPNSMIWLANDVSPKS